VGLVAVVVGSAGPVFAKTQGPWGTPEEAKPCEALDSVECKAEIARRAKSCMADPNEADNLAKTREWFPNDKAKADAKNLEWCAEVAKKIIGEQLERAAEQKKAAEKAKSELEAVEVPTAEMPYEAKLEKAVALAYNKDYQGGKILKIVLQGWSDDYEKDAFGRVTGRDLLATIVNKQPDGKCWLHTELWLQYGNGRSFSGPLSARGSGSLKETEILCSKAEAAASGPTSKKKHK
jgi:hypothetical protein